MPLADAKAKVVAHLRAALQAGDYPAGARLPTERALAESLGFDRRTVRAALRLLEEDGLVRRLSPHVRIAAYAAERLPAVFMRNSVLLITEEDSDETDDHRGTVRHQVDQGLVAAAQAAHLHVLTFHRSRLDPTELASALALHPRGVAVTEPALLGGAVMQFLPSSCARYGVPLVTCSDAPACQAVDRVVSDHAIGGALLTDWLVNRGCRRILEVGVSPDSAYWVAARTRGHRERCAAADIEPLPRMQVPGVFLVDRGRAEFERAVRFFAGYLAEWLVPGRVDAIMAQNDIDAVLVLEACRVLGVAPTQQPVVTGYDALLADHPIRNWTSCRPAVTVDKHNREQGAQMLAHLLERHGASLPRKPVRRLVAPELVMVPGTSPSHP